MSVICYISLLTELSESGVVRTINISPLTGLKNNGYVLQQTRAP